MTTLPRSSKRKEGANSQRAQGSKPTYLSGVNGLRALGIIAIVLYHLRPTSPAQGGFIGVTLFFVISGFLVSRSLLLEIEGERDIAVGAYILRRVVRLWPTMLLATAFSAIASFFYAPPLLLKMHEDAIPALAFFSNWFYIFRDVPYFAQAGLPSPLTHFWFVAVIMQFYVLAPIIVLLLREFFRSRGKAALVVLFFAGCFACEMALLFEPGSDSSRVYYGLDTRLAEILVGVALAYGEGCIERLNTLHTRLLQCASWCGLAYLVAVSIYARGYMTWLYRGGFFASALVCAIVVSGAIVPGAMSRVLSTRPLQVLASRSMSAYMWHYPLILLMNPARRTSVLPWWAWVVEAGIFLLITEASYRFVEKAPSFAHQKTWRALRGGAKNTRRVRLCTSVLSFALIVSIVIASIPGVFLEPASKKANEIFVSAASTPSASVASPSDSPSQEMTTTSPAPPSYHDANGKAVYPKAAIIPDNYDPSQWSCSLEDGTCTVPLVVIGDSVSEGASYYWIPTLFPQSFTDTEVGRSFEKGVAVYGEDLAKGHDGSPVIVALGGNGPITSMDSAQPLIEAAGERPVFFVTIRAPYPFQDENNALMRQLAQRYPQVGILDWYKASEGHDEYFYDDGQHLTEEGREAYARMMMTGLMGENN